MCNGVSILAKREHPAANGLHRNVANERCFSIKNKFLLPVAKAVDIKEDVTLSAKKAVSSLKLHQSLSRVIMSLVLLSFKL